MASHNTDSRKGRPRSLKRKREIEDVDALQKTVKELDVKKGEFGTFADLPLSEATATGLEASHFKTLTDIQQRAIPVALQGSDILGAAKTGSGKTLAFLVPVLENLYRKRWTEFDGLGALVLSPTRELAIQIFDVLRKIGRYHTFSAGLVIGGKSLQEERERLGRMNILVCTPGRMLQHMDQTAALEMDNLQMLVLDEADRIMDMGFQSTVDAIVEHLPKQRQTLLYSATQTKKVSDLARLSLRDAEYVSVHEKASTATPSTLQQHYIVTPLPQKLDVLWSFIRANVKTKILVFLSSGKQVRFVYESFRHLQPGIPLLHLHGRQKQTARLDITTKFASTKNACLFATDVVARGLDFPAVDWVVQVDCPEDADTYIHRVGRTARYERDGRAVLFLEPSEEAGMLGRLQQKKIPIEMIKVRQKKQQSIRSQLQNMCFKDPELKYLGQKAFVSYVRSVHVQQDKEVFRVQELPLEEFSASLGLPGAPNIRFRKGQDAKALKNRPRQLASSSEDEEETADGRRSKKEPVRTKYDRMFERRNQDILTEHYGNMIDDGNTQAADGKGDADEDEGFLTVKRRLGTASETGDESAGSESEEEHQAPGPAAATGEDATPVHSKRRERLLNSKKGITKLGARGTKLVYDEDGNAHRLYELENEDQFKQRGPADAQRAKFLQSEAERVRTADVVDKEAAKAKRRERREKRKAREAGPEEEDEDGDEDGGAVLVPYGEGPGDDTRKASEGRAAKRPRKWFEDDSDEGEGTHKGKGKGQGRRTEDAETLEDLEALAASYL